MRILLAIFSRNDKVLGISKTLKTMGHEVSTAYTDNYTHYCSYIAKKIDELGYHGGRKKFIRKWLANVGSMLDADKFDVMLFVNMPRDMLSAADLQGLHDKVKIKCWFVDGVSEHPELAEYYAYMDGIYVFEYNDMAFIQKMGGVERIVCSSRV